MSNDLLSSTNHSKKAKGYKLKRNEVQPIEINWYILRTGINRSSDSDMNDTKSDVNCKAYLATIGINNKAAETVIAHYNSIKALKYTKDNDTQNEECKVVIENAKENPKLFKECGGCPYW